MNKPTLLIVLSSALALAACGASEPTDTDAVAEDFSARINGAGAQPPVPQTAQAQNAQSTAAAPAPPTLAEPLPQAATGAFSPGTATDPASSICGANLMGPFLGRTADDATRAAVLETASSVQEVRFIPAGSPYVRPDSTNPRLNLMLDNLGIIRDARCG
ncbi:MAG: hypothetical protein AAF697_00210 [Pseudomonadota bacterium]